MALTICLATCWLAPMPHVSGQSPASKSIPEVLTKTIAYYASLTSYADSGTVTVDTGALVDKARFTTYFRRASRDLFFDFQWLTSVTVSTRYTIDMTAQRTVLWMFQGNMQSYQRSTPQPHQVVSPNNQLQALSGISYPTRGAAIMMTSLLYPQARLPSAMTRPHTSAASGARYSPTEATPSVANRDALMLPNW